MRKRNALLAAALAAVPAFVLAGTGAPAVNMVEAHGNMCMPATNDLTRNSVGIRNNTTGNRGVYCGFQVREGYSTGYENITVMMRNYGQVARTVSCSWKSGDPVSGYATYAMSVEVPNDTQAHFGSATTLSRPSSSSTLHVYCVLPPGIQLEHLQAWAANPA